MKISTHAYCRCALCLCCDGTGLTQHPTPLPLVTVCAPPYVCVATVTALATLQARCLSAAAEIIDASAGSVAGMVIEPIQAEGGDRGATPAFFRGLRQIVRSLVRSLVT